MYINTGVGLVVSVSIYRLTNIAIPFIKARRSSYVYSMRSMENVFVLKQTHDLLLSKRCIYMYIYIYIIIFVKYSFNIGITFLNIHNTRTSFHVWKLDFLALGQLNDWSGISAHGEIARKGMSPTMGERIGTKDKTFTAHYVSFEADDNWNTPINQIGNFPPRCPRNKPHSLPMRAR